MKTMENNIVLYRIEVKLKGISLAAQTGQIIFLDRLVIFFKQQLSKNPLFQKVKALDPRKAEAPIRMTPKLKNQKGRDHCFRWGFRRC